MNEMRYSIIDESGRMYDPNDRFIVFAAVVTNSLVGLDKIIPSVRKRLSKKIRLAEIKFSTTGDRTRNKVFEEIVKKNLKLFVLVIDKEGRKIKDNVENYSLLVSILLREIFKVYSETPHILIDKHFSFITQRENFNNLLQKRLNKELFIEHLDSQQNTIVSLPDFVSGAFRVAFTRDNNRFVEVVEKLVKKKVVTTWRNLYQKTKARV